MVALSLVYHMGMGTWVLEGYNSLHLIIGPTPNTVAPCGGMDRCRGSPRPKRCSTSFMRGCDVHPCGFPSYRYIDAKYPHSSSPGCTTHTISCLPSFRKASRPRLDHSSSPRFTFAHHTFGDLLLRVLQGRRRRLR